VRSPRTRAELVSLAEEDSCSLLWWWGRAEGEETKSIHFRRRRVPSAATKQEIHYPIIDWP